MTPTRFERLIYGAYVALAMLYLLVTLSTFLMASWTFLVLITNFY